MTTMAFPRSHFNPFPLFVVGILALMILASAHAVIAHGQSAITAQDCWNKGGQVMKQVYVDPLTGRHMSFCEKDGHWFVAINAPDGGNVTMFPRSMARCLSDVIEYAKRTGFTVKMLLH